MINTAYASILLDPAVSKVSPIVQQLQIYQEDGSHDIAVLRVRGADPTLPCFASGTPVHVRYGWNPVSVQDFYGYVNHVVPEHQHDITPSVGTMYFTIVCMGASFGMRDATSVGAWMEAQASSLVETLILRYKLSGLVETDDKPWTQLSNPGLSDWKFLISLTDKLGWTLACNQTRLRFLSLEKIMGQSTSSMPTFWTKNAAPHPSLFTINSFEVTQGDTAQPSVNRKAIRVVSNVDRATGKIFTVTSTPPSPLLGVSSPEPVFHVYETGTPADDQATATFALENITRKNRFYVQALATVAGNATLTQGIPVVLLGLGSTHSGTWYVQKVTHSIGAKNFISTLCLGRDAQLDNGVRPAHSPNIASEITDANAFSAPVPPTILVNGGWRAAYASTQELAA